MIPSGLFEATTAQVFEFVGQSAERTTLDYSSRLPGDDASKVGFLKAVSSLANTQGGVLVFGIEEADGLPTNVNGIQLPGQETIRLQLEGLIQDCIKPRIHGVDFQFVRLIEKGQEYVVVCRVPRSWAMPHAVSFRNHWRFYRRNSMGSYPMDVDELRAAFVARDTVLNRALSHRATRIGHIRSRDLEWMPVALRGGPGFAVHIIPLSAFTDRFAVNLEKVRDEKPLFIPMRGAAQDWQFSIFGFEKMAKSVNGPVISYTSVARSGIVEAVWVQGDGSSDEHISNRPEHVLVPAIKRYISDLVACEVTAPFLVCLSLFGVKGQRFPNPSDVHEKLTPFPHDQVLLPEVIVDDVGSDIERSLKPIFDMLWNAGGLPTSPHFDPLTGHIR